jgi:hypothetical protein
LSSRRREIICAGEVGIDMKISTRGPQIPRLQGKMIGLEQAAAKYPTNSEGGSDGGETWVGEEFLAAVF